MKKCGNQCLGLHLKKIFRTFCGLPFSNKRMQDVTADREMAEDGADDGGMDISIDESKVIPYPHKHHWTLCQEFLEVFGGASGTTLIDLSVGSGAKLLGVLLSNGRAVGVVRSQNHRKWVMQNLVDWVKQKRLVNVTSLPKPQVSWMHGRWFSELLIKFVMLLMVL